MATADLTSPLQADRGSIGGGPGFLRRGAARGEPAWVRAPAVRRSRPPAPGAWPGCSARAAGAPGGPRWGRSRSRPTCPCGAPRRCGPGRTRADPVRTPGPAARRTARSGWPSWAAAAPWAAGSPGRTGAPGGATGSTWTGGSPWPGRPPSRCRVPGPGQTLATGTGTGHHQRSRRPSFPLDLSVKREDGPPLPTGVGGRPVSLHLGDRTD